VAKSFEYKEVRKRRLSSGEILSVRTYQPGAEQRQVSRNSGWK
jgi:hypothetical protein